MADEETKPPASITNIYYDCLERIFDFLDLESLLNVANTCKRLQIAAAAKFSDEYGQKRIGITHVGRQNGIHVENDSIHIVGLKFQLPFLRCFGSKISHLAFAPPNELNTIAQQYIHQYCADTLTSFLLWLQPEFALQKPFKNLEKLIILNGDLSAKFPSYTNWYPNLRHLELHYVDIRTDFIAANLPHLEHLSISISQQTMERIADLLNVNQQLQSLDIKVIGSYKQAISLTIILNMIRSHRFISKIKVTLKAIAHVTTAETSQLANEHTSVVELNLQQFQLKSDDAVAFISRLNSLKKFEFCVRSKSECNRVRDQLNGNWQFKHWRVEWIEDFTLRNPVYFIELTRKIQVVK